MARYAYEGTVRAAILALKYRAHRRLVPFLASTLNQALEARPFSVDFLVPVPLGAARMHERGFNQSGLLAEALAAARGLKFEPDILIRHRETRQQARLPARDRLRNVAGAFSVPDSERVAGRRILLVDDVCTTGATLEACASILTEAGAEGVWAVVAARELASGTARRS